MRRKAETRVSQEIPIPIDLRTGLFKDPYLYLKQVLNQVPHVGATLMIFLKKWFAMQLEAKQA